ncbi:hypothetical protein U1Q18_004852 [Sarracenia purpurea var. burkii]
MLLYSHMLSDSSVFSLVLSTFSQQNSVQNALTVLYKYPSFHSHIPKPPKGVNAPGKCVSKKDVLPPPKLWHETSTIKGRAYNGRPLPKCLSGHYLGKLAHRLVCEYYLAKKPGSQRCMEVGDHIGVDDLALQSNLKETVSGKEPDGKSENCIAFEPRKRKRIRVCGCQAKLKKQNVILSY